MGEWLAEHGVSFRCIGYGTAEVESRRFLTFSWRFDRSPRSLFPIIFGNRMREQGFFWHNIGMAEEGWWSHLKNRQEISASFDCAPGDEGERILKSYIEGDSILAYAAGFGAIGFGVIENPSGYKLLPSGGKDDILQGHHLHRLPIRWKAVSSNLSEGMPPEELRRVYGIFHPLRTSVPVDDSKANSLIQDMQKRWPLNNH
jgi:hypothetical protein